MKPGITVIIATFPKRSQLLCRALASVQAQTRPPEAIAIASDVDKEGEAITRTRALQMVKTEWAAVLDDDDEFLPDHLEKLWQHARMSGADLVYSWFTVVGGTDPHPENFGRQFDPEDPHHTTSTTLFRTKLGRQVGGYLYQDGNPNQARQHGGFGPDFRFTEKMSVAGAKISHLPERTWLYHHDSGNTSGLPERQ